MRKMFTIALAALAMVALPAIAYVQSSGDPPMVVSAWAQPALALPVLQATSATLALPATPVSLATLAAPVSLATSAMSGHVSPFTARAGHYDTDDPVLR